MTDENKRKEIFDSMLNRMDEENHPLSLMMAENDQKTSQIHQWCADNPDSAIAVMCEFLEMTAPTVTNIPLSVRLGYWAVSHPPELSMMLLNLACLQLHQCLMSAVEIHKEENAS